MIKVWTVTGKVLTFAEGDPPPQPSLWHRLLLAMDRGTTLTVPGDVTMDGHPLMLNGRHVMVAEQVPDADE